jgi:hypothetical protein
MNFRYRKSSQAKKIKTVSRSEEDLRSQQITVLHQFRFSLPLLNLLRDPETDGRDFAPAFLAEVAAQLRRVNAPESSTHDELALYLHLILAQVDNLYEMEELGRKGGEMAKFNADKWNHTNILNAKCLLASLHYHELLPEPTPSPPEGSLLDTQEQEPLEAVQPEEEQGEASSPS